MAESELTGQILGTRYRVEAFLGRGGMADVYKVRDLQRAVFLAMKVLHADLAEDQVFLNRFVREAQTLELLQHPNIVRFYGLEEADDLAFILMDYIDGPTLRKEIAVSKTGLSHQRILEVMQPVCAALFYAHQMGLVHCDIKPANIMIHRNGTIYLADFGISRMTESSTVTLAGAGTPAYMAPEQLAGDDPVPTMDIYALGVVLFEMLTGGKRPFTGESAQGTGSSTQKIVWEKAHTTAPSPRKYNPDIPTELEEIVQRCLDTNPAKRYQTALELLTALEAAIQGKEDTDEQITHVDLQQKPAEASRATHARLVRKPGDTRSNGSAAGAAEAAEAAATADQAAGGEAAPSGEEAAALPQAEEGAAAAPNGQMVSPDGQTVSPNGQTNIIQPAAGQGSQGPAWITALQAKIIKHPWAWIVGAGVLIAVAALIINSQSVHAPTPVATTAAGISTTQVSAVTGPVINAGAPGTTPAEPAATATQPAPAAVATSAPTLAPSATPTPQPTPIGGGGKIAFASDRSGSVQVWYMDANNPDDRHQATTESRGACQPAWSPDGTQIAFTTPCIGPSLFYNGSTIKIVNLADLLVTPLTVTGAGTSAAFDPAWSPDGKTLAYTAIIGGRTEIRAIDMQDKKTVRVLANRGTKNAQPAWSRDGRYIVYISSEKRDQDMLWYMGPNGESQEMLSRAAKYADPVWSPDGTHILSSVNFGNAIPTLALFDRSNPTLPAEPLLPSGSDRGSHGTFSPDGQWIIFWTEKAGNPPELVLVSVDGKQVKQITNNILRDFQPSWSLK